MTLFKRFAASAAGLLPALMPAVLAAFLVGCGGGGLDPILGSPGAGAVPTVTATSPVASTPIVTGVASSSVVTAAFSKAMAGETITAASFLLACPAVTPVSASVSYNESTRVATLTPRAALPPGSLCVATVTTAVLDTMGFALASNFTWSFVTASAADLTRPTVVLTVPAAGASDVGNNTAITATFSEDMNPASISGSSFRLVNDTLGAAVPGTVTYSATGRTAVFTPTGPATLAANSQFTATVTTGATDLAGNALAANVAWTFTTAALPDSTRPTIVLTLPAAGATAVANNTAITATFSEDMNPASVSGSSFSLVNNTLGVAVPGTVTYSATSRTAIFTPTTPATLAASSQFTATVTTAAADLAGNALAANFVWTFTTAALPDTTRPSVLVTVPAANATAVASNTAITATFSEDMNPASISGRSFTLVDNTLGLGVPGTVTYSATGRTAIFTPTTPATLAANSPFTATVTTGATDLAGNALAANFTWTFTTAALPDSTRPTIVLTAPAANATAVPTDTAISATFSEDMNPTSVSGANFRLVNTTLGTGVPGTVTYSAPGRTLIFTPTGPATLAANSSFTATVTTGVTDLAGNALAANFAWTFTTAGGGGGTTAPPTVTAISPQDGSTVGCPSGSVTATFSGPMNGSTINTSTFTVTDNGIAVAGTVDYDASLRQARFVPSAASGLARGRTFVVTVVSGNAGVKDLADRTLASDRAWTFTTGSQTCQTISINLGSAASFAAFGGTAGVTNQGINTVLGGNVGSTAVCTAITGLHDAANVYTETPLNIGAVNGSLYCAPPAPGTTTSLAIATQARADAQTAYNALAALPPGPDPGAGQLGGLVLPPGVYTAAGGTFGITSGNLTLDAQGDANAVWVFQSAAALTVGQPALPRSVSLINGARAGNVYWQVGSAARIEDRSVMVGTIIAPAGVTISTAGQTAQTFLTGRAIGLTASVTMVNTTIVAP
jgi:hypothetical protein